ncbi:MAG: Guanylate cyclase protein [Patescibacteria group bacterium]|nr:Guanylate cyclase protein [Patescibacteria group bacterium]
MKNLRRKEDIFFGLSVILLVLLAYLISESIFGVRLNRILSDRVYDTQTRNEVVVVGVDDASLQSLGAWPWKRDIFARAVDRLYQEGARLVVFDILFLEKREGDNDVESALSKNKKPTIFASKLDDKGNLLASVYQDNQFTKTGIAHVYPNDDGKVRETYFFFNDNDGYCVPTLSYLAFTAYTKNDIGVCDTTSHPFVYQASSPRTISIRDVVQGNEIGDVKDKVVFIGSVSLDLEDHFVSLGGEKIPGVYVHASMFTTLLNNSFPKTLPTTTTAVLVFLVVVYASFISLRFNKTLVQATLFFLGVIGIIVCGFLGYGLGYVVPFSFLLITHALVSVYGFMFRYVRTERKNEHIRNLFGKYVHKDVLHELMESGREVKLGGEKRDVSVLFSDIRGFTSFSETMSPEELTGLLNAYLSAMSPQILEEKGTIDKFIGDAIMAFWNAPLKLKNHPLHAVKAALRMVDALEVFNKEHKATLAVGIGLNTGEVVVGNIGSQDRINYTILGDVVNTGSRLESLTKKYGVEILASEEVRNKIEEKDIAWRKLDVITVKGKSEPTTIYEVRRASHFKQGVVAEYEKGLQCYTQGDFEGALAVFGALANSGDIPSQKMVEKIPTINKSTWDGVWHFDEK